MLAGRVKGQKTSLATMFGAVGAYSAGRMGEEELTEYEEKSCPSCGSCSGMFTANSMNCLTEVLGMGLCGNGTIPAVYSARIELAKRAGLQIMELVKSDIKPLDIMTEASLAISLRSVLALVRPLTSLPTPPAIAHVFALD